MNIFLKSLSILWLIPLLTLAIEPTNPNTICDRFVGEKDQQACEDKMKKDDVDWYAATVCSLTQEDAQFWNCWDKIKGARFNPNHLDACGENKTLNDSERITCIEKARIQRVPASADASLLEFQPKSFKKASQQTGQ